MSPTDEVFFTNLECGHFGVPENEAYDLVTLVTAALRLWIGTEHFLSEVTDNWWSVKQHKFAFAGWTVATRI